MGILQHVLLLFKERSEKQFRYWSFPMSVLMDHQQVMFSTFLDSSLVHSSQVTLQWKWWKNWDPQQSIWSHLLKIKAALQEKKKFPVQCPYWMGQPLVLSRGEHKAYTHPILRKSVIPHIQQRTVPAVLTSRASLWAWWRQVQFTA